MRLEKLPADPGTEDDAAQTIELARRLETAWVVLDGYHFTGRFQQAIKQAVHRLLGIVDYGNAEH